MKSVRVRWHVVVLVAVVAAFGLKFMLEKLVLPAPAPENFTLIEPGYYMGGQCTAPPPDVRAVLNLSQYADSYGAEIHRWQPIPDSEPAPSLSWLRDQVQFIDTQRKAGRPVFVHCDAGVSRSGLVSAAYFMWRDHLTREQALAFLRQRRPIVRPNRAFMELLGEWERELHAPIEPAPVTSAPRAPQ